MSEVRKNLSELPEAPANRKSAEGHKEDTVLLLGRARKFLRNIEKKYHVPELSFRESSSVFVCIPLYDEDSTTVQRLFETWDASILPEGVTVELLFFVNNTPTSPEGVKKNNETTLQLLQDFLKDSHNTAMQYHVVDASSSSHELSSDTPIGTIRNCSIAPVIAHVAKTKRNVLIFSSDADTFPAPNVLSELQATFQKKDSLYGVVPLRLDYDSTFSPEEIKDIERILLCMDVHKTLFSFLTGGGLRYEPIHGGANTFYSCDRFLAVGGYRNALKTAEDIQLSQDLKVKFLDSSTTLEHSSMVNTIRYSRRLEGDGDMLATIKDSKWLVHFHERNLLYRVYLENWYKNNAGNRPYDEAPGLLDSIPENLLSSEEREEFKKTIATLEKTLRGDELYDRIFEEGLKYLYKHTMNREHTPQQALESYTALIQELFQHDQDFIRFFKTEKAFYGLLRDESILLGQALIKYAKSKSI